MRREPAASKYCFSSAKQSETGIACCKELANIVFEVRVPALARGREVASIILLVQCVVHNGGLEPRDAYGKPVVPLLAGLEPRASATRSLIPRHLTQSRDFGGGSHRLSTMPRERLQDLQRTICREEVFACG